MKNNKVLFTILGKAGSGKDTLVNMLEKETELNRVISHTTRPPRSGEKDGVDYHFIPEYIFDDMNSKGEFLETTSYFIESEGVEYKYGYNKNVLDDIPYAMMIVNPHGFKEISQYEDLNIVSIQLVRNDRDRIMSYLQRDENVNVNELIDRWKRDEEDFEYLFTDYLVYNDGDLNDTFENLKSIIELELEDIKYKDKIDKLLNIE